MLRIRDLAVVCVVMCVWAVPSVAHATPIDLTGVTSGAAQFSGQFDHDNDFAEILFSIVSPSAFTARTTSYGDPEINGFDPMLHLFDGTGHIVQIPQADGSTVEAFNDDAVPFPDDPTTPPVRDSLIEIASLAPGTYALVLTQYFNYPNSPFNTGFSQDSSDLFDLTRYTSCPNGNLNTEQEPDLCPGFVDLNADRRNAAFAGTLTITPAEQPAPVPEPGTLTLLAGGLGALAARRRRRRASNEQRVLPVVTLGQSRR